MRYKTECPRCGKTGEVDIDPTKTSHVRCGDCLMNDVVIVSMTLTEVPMHPDTLAVLKRINRS